MALSFPFYRTVVTCAFDGYLKANVFNQCPRNIEELQEVVCEAIARISRGMPNRVTKDFRKQFHILIREPIGPYTLYDLIEKKTYVPRKSCTVLLEFTSEMCELYPVALRNDTQVADSDSELSFYVCK